MDRRKPDSLDSCFILPIANFAAMAGETRRGIENIEFSPSSSDIWGTSRDSMPSRIRSNLNTCDPLTGRQWFG